MEGRRAISIRPAAHPDTSLRQDGAERRYSGKTPGEYAPRRRSAVP